MRVNCINSYDKYNCTFGDKILTKENKKMVEALKGRFESFKEQGLPVGDCYYKMPENSPLSLKTKDKKYSAGMSALGNNLFVRRVENNDYMTISIAPDNDVKYWEMGLDIIESVKNESPLADKVNKFLSDVLPKFL